MTEIRSPISLNELRVKNRFLRRDFGNMFDAFFGVTEAPRRTAVVVVSHSGTISNMLYSHTAKAEEEVLKPRNASVIAINDSGALDLEHEGTLPDCKASEWHEYFTVPQFVDFATGTSFGYVPPQSCLLLLVRHGIAINNVNKAYMDGRLTAEGEASIANAAVHITRMLQQHNIRTVNIFTSAFVRTRHSSDLLYGMLGRRHHLGPSRSLPCLLLLTAAGSSGGTAAATTPAGLGSCGSETEPASEEVWMQSPGGVPVGV